jgi:hypothetical protein
MSTRYLITLIAFLIVGFALCYSNAVADSGGDAGNLWLLTALIIGVALIATILTVVATVVRARQTHEDPRLHSEPRTPSSAPIGGHVFRR